MVFTLTPLINPFLKRGPISWPSQVISFWGGLRGAVALALALSLAGRFPDSDLLIAMTIGVAVFTIVVSGLTVGPLIHRLRLDQPEPLARLEEAQARVLARQEAMRRFAELETKPFVSASALEELSKLYAAQVQEAERRLSTTWTELTAGEDVRRRAVWLQALQIENQKYREVYDEEILSVANSDRLKLMLNLKRDAILTSRFPLPYPTSETLESTLRERLIKKVAGVFPRSQWLQRQEDLSIQKHYEFDLAVARIAEEVSGQMVQLGRQLATETDRAAFEACSVWYATASRLAFDRMSVWKEQHPAQVLNILLRLAQRAVKASARNKLDKLVTGGVIGQNVAQKIRLEFDRGEGSQ
jgi:CPA1 family monovalent cation:H+ antiporter